MRFVRFEATAETVYIVAEHVAFLRVGTDGFTRIHMVGGQEIAVTEDADAVGLKLQGRKQS